MNSGRRTFTDMSIGGAAVTGNDVAICFPSFVASSSATTCIGPFALAVSIRTVSYSTFIAGTSEVDPGETVVAAKVGTAVRVQKAKSSRAPMNGKFQEFSFMVNSRFLESGGRAKSARNQRRQNLGC